MFQNDRQPKTTDLVQGGNNPVQSFAVLGTASQCQHPEHLQFCRDMAVAGIATHIGTGRFGWCGPMVSADDVFDVMSKTQIRCIWDECGKGVIVYPAVYTTDALLDVIHNWDSCQAGIAIYSRLGQPFSAIAKNTLKQVQDFINVI